MKSWVQRAIGQGQSSLRATPSQPKEYIYRPLESHKHIRVLSCSSDGKICSLQHESLDNVVPYFAMSYAWGDPETTSHMIVDGKILRISKNLSEFLSEWFKRPDRARGTRIWIDAICINQQDLIEKSQQVMLMKVIYETSYQVIVWLGKPADDSELAMAQMLKWGKLLEDLIAIRGDDDPNLAQLFQNAVGPLKAIPGTELYRACKAIHKFFLRPWWYRAWIAQEGSCPKKTRWLWTGGQDSIDLGWLSVIAALFLSLAVAENPGFDNYAEDLSCAIGPINSLRVARRKGRQMSLIQVLGKLPRFSCTKPQDKIYVAVGLATIPSVSTVPADELVPDYTKPVRAVYMEAVSAILCRSDKQCLLSFLGQVKIPGQDWLPTWKVNKLEYSMFGVYWDGEMAIGAYNPCSDVWTDVHIQDSVLKVSGLCFDTVDKVYPVFREMTHVPEETILRFWMPSNPRDSYPSSGTVEEAFYHTLVADLKIGPSKDGFSRGVSFDWELAAKSDSELDLEATRKRDEMLASLRVVCWARRLFWTSNGYIGIGPPSMKRNDMVCVLGGGQVLYILRQEEPDVFTFVGECYLHGMMDGQAMKYHDDGTPDFREFQIR
ncbi:uncharacterized protein PAC_18727 [Phialocephala subalpina]|uniref:Heterokaryon incompatibility domain-containing protein n=1 Tax=Phialocephala subalpina TaxID=576137 RepID=A0A1L7XUZ9_9HELO|nr:uncharacterized protein PAC_18727 [Phialocephala subalpina]